LTLKRVNPAIALWFVLHYPEGEARLYAWKHIQLTEASKDIKHPDKFLESLIKDKNPDLDWLLDQRTKDLIRKELKKILGRENQPPKGEKEKSVENDREMEELLLQLEEIKPLMQLLFDDIQKEFKVDNLRDFLKSLEKDKELLKRVIDFVNQRV